MTKSSAPFVQRLASVDVYRGFVMFLMMAEVLEFSKVSRAVPDSRFWQFLSFHQSHVPWVGCSLHDLIQPSFSFLVGVALPFSIAGRVAKGGKFSDLFLHTLKRSLILILLGVFLRSMGREMTNWTFEDTLSQIGLGYPFLFLLGFRSLKIQVAALAVILVGYWLAFALYPLPGPAFDYALAGTAPDWEHNLQGFAAHWNRNTNFAWAFDRWFMNIFPRTKEFFNNGGGYSTLSFIPTLGTMILGLIAGKLLKEESPGSDKIRKFLTLGLGLVVAGVLLNVLGICPNVKRIWTPTWVLFSGGLCFLFLALFYFVVDIRGNVKAFDWLKIIGMNSIAAYVLAHTVNDFIDESFKTNISQNYDMIFGESYHTLVSGFVILAVEWWVLYWMYKKKLFIKI